MEEKSKAVVTAGVNDLTITIVYDNNSYKEGLETQWGFSALITCNGNNILFDTGGAGPLLLDNMRKLAIEPNSIEIVVLSHIHGDHTGGLDGFLEKNSDITVYLPESFPKRFKDNVKDKEANVVEVEESLEICKGVYSAGRLGMLIKEQSLVVQTEKGLIVITGCAHPGIVKIVNTARDLLKDDVLLVAGGFHLEWTGKGRIERIISAFRQSGVRYVGPCHCSSEKSKDLFRRSFGGNYISLGAGKVITLADLQ